MSASAWRDVVPGEHGRPLAVLEHADDAVAANFFRHFKAQGAQLRREAGRRLHFLKRQLGLTVELLVNGVKPGQLFLKALANDLGHFGCRDCLRIELSGKIWNEGHQHNCCNRFS